MEGFLFADFSFPIRQTFTEDNRIGARNSRRGWRRVAYPSEPSWLAYSRRSFTAPFHRGAVIDEGPSRCDIISSRRTPNLPARPEPNPRYLSALSPSTPSLPPPPPPRQAGIIILVRSPFLLEPTPFVPVACPR